MKKIILTIFICIFSCLVFVGCGGKKQKEISFDDLLDIVWENDPLTWKCFDKYEYEEEYGGLYYRRYDVEGDYMLEVSGRNDSDAPYSFKLIRLSDNDSIDISKQDIVSFLGDDY